MNLDKHLPIGTSDAGSLMSTTLASGIDFFMANVHPWFGSVGATGAAAWTANFFDDFDVVGVWVCTAGRSLMRVCCGYCSESAQLLHCRDWMAYRVG